MNMDDFLNLGRICMFPLGSEYFLRGLTDDITTANYDTRAPGKVPLRKSSGEPYDVVQDTTDTFAPC